MIRTATLVRLAPATGHDREDGPLVRDLAAWVRCPTIAGDLELGPLAFVATGPLADLSLDLEVANVSAVDAIAAAAGLEVLLLELDNAKGRHVVMLAPILPLADA